MEPGSIYNSADPVHCEVVDPVADAAVLFARIAARPWAAWLDSGGSDRWSILAMDPWATVVTRGEETRVATRETAWSTGEDPFAVIRSLVPAAARGQPLPFAGGAIGYCAYDLGRRVNQLPVLPPGDGRLPDLAFGIYDTALVIDHDDGRAALVGAGDGPGTRALRGRWRALLGPEPGPAPAPGFRVRQALAPELAKKDYQAAVARIKRYIFDGDCYQVNYTQPFRARIDGDPLAFYRVLRGASTAPFGAYLNLPFAQVLSASPERFLKVAGGLVETQPIKGTRPRSSDPALDRRNAAQLVNSDKDRAENLMIVDLLRNDLGKVCRTGSISVPRLFELKSYYNVHHLVSTVTGTLADGMDAWDALAACFPGGSITGAPKRRAMEIIDELECRPRGVYCGAIGYCSADGGMDMNIAIRTVVHRAGDLEVWGGGGIVADSDTEDEYRESIDKLSGFRALLS